MAKLQDNRLRMEVKRASSPKSIDCSLHKKLVDKPFLQRWLVCEGCIAMTDGSFGAGCSAFGFCVSVNKKHLFFC
uniref:Uncharacterized protein n=1 Tax=Nelumbo nucifera TaxID=4432 RepID=A0A822ZFK5_NELNU|nr:TPA_asm: hypothetical protein HUJ06_003184 [Nelumbo nucifera]